MMDYSGTNFVEAVNDLAARVGMQVPAQQPESRSGTGETRIIRLAARPISRMTNSSFQDLVEVMNVAARFYRQQLKYFKSAIAYLKKRGLTGETAARFGIGYAPAGWQNLDAAFSDTEAGARANPSGQGRVCRSGTMREIVMSVSAIASCFPF